MIREDLLALADELEGMDCHEGCRTCPADGTKDCRGDLSCEEAVARAAARRVREIIEHDECEVTTVSAYDLLSDDDREALAWVRKHGGLDEVEKRLIPEGMEWPKVDGKPVDFNTCYKPSVGALEAVCIYNNRACEVMGHDGIIKPVSEIHAIVNAADGKPLEAGQTVWDVESGTEYEVVGIHTDEDSPVRVMRTDGSHLAKASKPSTLTHQRPVLDAEWNRIEPDMDVWWVCEGDERGIHAEMLHVDGIDGDGMVECSPYNGGTSVVLDPAELYVNKPVLDADGVPIKVGDTVWDTETGCGRTVRAVNDNETVEFDGYENRGWFGKFLTHTKPEIDSWERIEWDKGLNPFDYCKKVGHKLWTFDNAEEFKAADLVRRARALAERGEK